MLRKFTNFEDELLIEQVRKYRSLFDHKHKDFKDHQIRENIWAEIGVALSKSSEDCKLRWKNIRDNYYKIKRNQKQGTGPAASKQPKWTLFGHLTFLDLTKFEQRRINNYSESQTTIDVDPLRKGSVDGDISDSESQENTDNIDDEVDGEASESKYDILRHASKKFKPNNTEDTSHSDTLLSRSSTLCRNASSSTSKRNKLLQNLEEWSQKRLEIISHLSHQKEEDEVDLFMRSIALMVKKLPPHSISQAKLQILTLVTELQSQASPSRSAPSDSI